MFDFLDIASPEPTVTETVFNKGIIIGLIVFVALVIAVTVVILNKNKNK